MPHLVLPASMSNMDPSASSMLHLDLAGCDADCLFIQLLHNVWQNNTEYAVMPPALRHSLVIPWDIRMEEFPKLWQNTIYITWKAGAPSQDVDLAMTLVTTCRKEFETRRMVIDISNEAQIQYPASNLDDDDAEEEVVDSNDSVEDLPGGGEGEDNSDDDDNFDKDIRQMALEVANKTDDSSTGVASKTTPRLRH